MIPANYNQMLDGLQHIFEAIRLNHYSHDHRNERFCTIQNLIELWMTDLGRGAYDYEVEEQIKVLRTIYDLSVWTLKHETHTAVKSRIRLIEEVILAAKLEDERKKKILIFGNAP